MVSRSYFFFNDTATTEIYTLSLHDALPIFGTLRFYLLSHPDHVKWVLQENAKNYSKGYDRVKVLLGNGLVMNEGASWLQQRRLMQPIFHQRRLEGFVATMVEETQKMLERWLSRVRPCPPSPP